MLNTSDVFTGNGYNRLYGCWTEPVTKYDANSFYNYEQDNLPILDLEERTSLLWERLGSPTSAITGFSFVVSSLTPSCNSNYFSSLSACLQKLPEVINAPYLIEVASFGNLGDLVLSNKTFGPRGSIEIINRNFGKAEPESNVYVYNGEIARADSSYGIASAIGPANATLQTGLGLGLVIPTVMSDLYLSRIYSNSSLVFSSQASMDTRLVNNLTVFTRKSLPDDNNRMSVAIAAKNSTSGWTTVAGSNHKVSFTAYEHNAESTDLINTYDASCINEISNSEIIWKNTTFDDATPAMTIAYGNRLSKIKVHNCNGTIVIRNFTVDGGGYTGNTEFGMDIRNSTVHLDNCSVSRCTKAGLHAINSKINLTRGFAAYRNYGFDTSGNRNGISWLNKITQVNSSQTQNEFAAGVYLNNSELSFSSTYARDTSAFSTHLSAIYDATLVNEQIIPTMGWFFCLSKNEIGLHAVNSKIYGGRTELSGIASIAFYDAHQIISELNTEAGFKLENSELEHSGRLFFYGNYRGLHGINSKLETDTIAFKFNQKEGCLLENSKLKYNRNLYKIYLKSNPSIAETYGLHQNAFFLNGTHLKLVNSTYEPFETYGVGVSSTPNYHERFVASGSFGITQNLSDQKNILPSIIVDNNSKLVAIHPGIITSDDFLESKKPLHGAAISVTNNSELVLKGSKDFVSKIIGPTTYNLQKRKAGLYANNQSNIKIQGPTVIAKYAIDILADNGSKIEFSPHRTSDGRLDVSGYKLSDKGNHTTVELHSTRACLVADNGSIINMEDLGDYTTRWTGTNGLAAIASGVDYLTNTAGELTTATYTSGGSLQFYPNPNDPVHYPPAIVNPSIDLYSNYTMSLNANGQYYFFNDLTNQNSLSAITFGGMCLRALNGSKVNVDNVHFPCGWWIPSGTIYDVSSDANLCSRLFIWNIADLSQLDAKLVSVSGGHPADIGYVGPSGVWGSASSAPLGTPDTSSVSILDFYGRSTNHLYSRSTAANQGPFRLYFSTDPACNWLITSSNTLSGYASQLFSQGYQFSSNLVAPGNVSSFYMSLLRQSGNILVASGFYYASAMVFAPFTTRVLLDDSAANTFANAKHNSVGKSGLAKVVAIYFPYTGTYGGDSAGSDSKSVGLGVRSVNTFDLEKDN